LILYEINGFTKGDRTFVHDGLFQRTSKNYGNNISIDKMNRRNMLKYASVTSLSLAVPSVSFAKETALAINNPGYFHFKLGELQLTVITDGHIPLKPVQPTFAPGISDRQVKEVLIDHYLPSDEIDNAINLLLIQKANKRILIDTGSGSQLGEEAGRMKQNLRMSGTNPEDITDIVITHLHSDHIGGIINENGSLVFTQAKYYLAQSEYDFWMADKPDFSKRKNPHPDWDLAATSLARNIIGCLKGRLILFNDGDTLFDCIHTRLAAGHTPGHTILSIHSGNQILEHIVDTVHTQLLFVHPEWGTEWDVDYELGITSRERILKELASSRKLTFTCHLPWPGLGYIKKGLVGYEWLPNSIATP
jgi:glyoxylase-like metal-dependent hydrolase (beta-lactamase superfamily II)